MSPTSISEPLDLEGLPDAVSGETLSETAILLLCAKAMNVPFTSVWRAKQVKKYGIPELRTAIEADHISLNAAFWAATNLTHEDQRWLLQQGTKREISQTIAAIKRADAEPTEPCPHCDGTGRL